MYLLNLTVNLSKYTGTVPHNMREFKKPPDKFQTSNPGKET